MPHSQLLPEPWRSFLKEMDAAATSELRRDCIGGFVMTMRYGMPRTTGDVDVLVTVGENPAVFEIAREGGPRHKKHGVYLDVVTVAQVPCDYEDRVVEMFPGEFKHLRVVALDPYDLALAKLERNLERDRADVKYLAREVPFDLEVFRQRY